MNNKFKNNSLLSNEIEEHGKKALEITAEYDPFMNDIYIDESEILEKASLLLLDKNIYLYVSSYDGFTYLITEKGECYNMNIYALSNEPITTFKQLFLGCITKITYYLDDNSKEVYERFMDGQ